MNREELAEGHDFSGAPDDWIVVDGHPFPPNLRVVAEVPVPRHDWGDVLVCFECDPPRAWLTERAPDPEPEVSGRWR